ncbi:MAG: chemotaxis response regulator protein-glutamate methylesterase [Planctomycetes bacterium]|nr:chemotaxis response regulator protein-glutamate methylesterase [Planctomycetota bacterium]MCH9724772.1 chemotaxis response regulator protein-glutamate methylesterase [Planctomycetota bacterium]MCH9778712.1 chemotaxis response regulator protein-glutamate methylesterase [Planctomycetota bacterium]MDF1746976.1 chemotaxis response regulator protein-glutamate methylesterase [Gimesia sp.]
MPVDRIRIIVVDDSTLFRQLIRDVLNEIPGCSIVGNADNGTTALQKIEQLKPDLITLDVEMPDMNGIEVLRELNRKNLNSSAIMVSKLTAAGAQVTTDALFEGAFDFVLKPSGKNLAENKGALLTALREKVTAFQQSLTEKAQPKPDTSTLDQETVKLQRYEAVVIGTSTGGPTALREVLPKLPSTFPLPVLVVQHMPAQYTSRLASRLNDLCSLNVVEASDNMTVCAGNIYIAPGGCQMKVVSRNGLIRVKLTDDSPVNNCRPSVDYLFESAHDAWGGQLIAVIMTGMGKDGMQGCQRIRNSGGYIIAQSPEDCTVYGMPKSIIENDLSHRIADLKTIPSIIIHRAQLSARS